MEHWGIITCKLGRTPAMVLFTGLGRDTSSGDSLEAHIDMDSKTLLLPTWWVWQRGGIAYTYLQKVLHHGWGHVAFSGTRSTPTHSHSYERPQFGLVELLSTCQTSSEHRITQSILAIFEWYIVQHPQQKSVITVRWPEYKCDEDHLFCWGWFLLPGWLSCERS